MKAKTSSPKDLKPTESLSRVQTAWVELATAAANFLENFRGSVTDQNKEDVLALGRAVLRVIRTEGLHLQPQTDEYEITVERSEEPSDE